jgi:hypothetical protein
MKGSALLGASTLCLAMAVAACGKDGATGPQGPAGAAGPQGQPGPSGSANVIYSAWFTPSPWAVDTIFGMINFNFVQAAPGITQSILDSGIVLTYGKLNGYTPTIWPTDQVAELPIVITYTEGSTTYTDTWSAYATVDSLRINFVDNVNLYNSISTAHSFRYVVVPGGVADADRVVRFPAPGGVRYTREQLRAMPYERVARLFHIPPR